MTPPSTTREALIIEALGEAAKLIRQVEELAPALDESRQALEQAQSGLVGQLAAFEVQILALSERAKVQTVSHVLARTEHATRIGIENQAQAMAKAASKLFDSRVDPRIQQLARVITHQVDHLSHPWERWLVHAATALASCVATLAVVSHIWPR